MLRLPVKGRNVFTGPGFANIDFSLSKSMDLGAENHRLQLRGDFFNLFNHPNFDIPSHVFAPAPRNNQFAAPTADPASGRFSRRMPMAISRRVRFS